MALNCSCMQIAHTCKTANFVILLAMTQQGDTVTALISPVRKKGFIADAKRDPDPEPSPTAVVEDKEEYDNPRSCTSLR